MGFRKPKILHICLQKSWETIKIRSKNISLRKHTHTQSDFSKSVGIIFCLEKESEWTKKQFAKHHGRCIHSVPLNFTDQLGYLGRALMQ